MKRATSMLTSPVTVHLTEPERAPIVIAPGQSVDLDQIVAQVAAVRDAAGTVTAPARGVSLSEALGSDLVAQFEIAMPLTPAAAAARRSAHVPVTGPKAASAAPEPQKET